MIMLFDYFFDIVFINIIEIAEIAGILDENLQFQRLIEY